MVRIFRNGGRRRREDSSLNDEASEIQVLTTEEAERLARACRDSKDPFSDQEVPPSLLSADHIEKYVLKTGLIAPFYLGGGRKSRLKKASYEGRIGKKAYIFNENNQLELVFEPDKPLVVPANSIVFVESDLDFRLPRYIAMRFNLQIRHVHRGLLLGTGPLVDPGYWGKLCIPLHNLTNEPYEIPLEEGLIWVEFTKTTSNSKEGRITLTKGDEHAEHWEIDKFLRKAAKPFVEGKPSIAIRSSIPIVVAQATKDGTTALAASQAAERNATAAQDVLKRIGYLGAAAAAIAVFSLWATFYFGHQANLNQLRSELVELRATNAAAIERLTAGQARESELFRRLEKSEADIEILRRENMSLRRRPSAKPQDDLPPATPNAK